VTVRVLIDASDPVSRAGVLALLRPAREVELVTTGERADVVLLVEPSVPAARLEEVDRFRGKARVVVVTEELAERDMMTAVRCGVVSVLSAATTTAGRLVSAIVGVRHGRASMPHNLQAALLRQLAELRRDLLAPNGITLSGLDDRELDVLGLIAEGFRTDEIAAKLSYSEGTVKGVLHGTMTRLGLVNRAHAVAYAIRAGALS
jgi:DNA-binding NarL/FixJ family response regulator